LPAQAPGHARGAARADRVPVRRVRARGHRRGRAGNARHCRGRGGAGPARGRGGAAFRALRLPRRAGDRLGAGGRADRVSDFLQLVVAGTATGGCYALAALGFTLLWQASGTINFALGEMIMLPAFSMLLFIKLGLPLPLAFGITVLLAMLVLGAGFKRLVVDPLIRHGIVPLVIATLGLSIAFKQGARVAYSAQVYTFPSSFPD